MIGALLTLSLLAGIALIVAGLADTRRHRIVARLARVRGRARQTGATSPWFVLTVAGGAVTASMLAWELNGIPVFAMAGGICGGYAPFVWLQRRTERRLRDRERAWPAALAQLADALEAGIAVPAALALLGDAGPVPLRGEFTRLHAQLRVGGLADALEHLASSGERTAGTVALLLRAGLIDLPAGGLAPMLRDLAVMLNERFEAREKARTKTASLQLEAAILALSPIVLLLLVGTASPDYLAAYRTPAGTAVATAGAIAILGCYLLMRRLGRLPEPQRKPGAS